MLEGITETDKVDNMNILVLFLLLLFSQFSDSQRKEEMVTDGSGHVMIVERVPRSQDAATYNNKNRKRYLRRRERMLKWCSSRVKAKTIDNKVEWEKIVGVTVVLLGIVHVVYFCKQDGRMF